MGKSKVSASLIVGKNLKKLIKESKWETQERFAREAANVDPTTVRRWIHKGINDLRIIENICELFNISLEDILK